MPFQSLNLKSVSKPTPGFKPLGGSSVTPTPTPQPVEQPTFFQNVLGGAKKIGSDIFHAATAPIGEANNPGGVGGVGGDIAGTAINSYANSLKDAANRFSEFKRLNPYVSPGSAQSRVPKTLEQNVATGNALMGGLSAFFAPLTAAGEGAAQIPVLGHVAQGINNLFSAIGTGGADIGEGALQSIPGISQQTKDKLLPLTREVFSLGAQVVAGIGGDKLHESFTSKTKDLVHSLSDSIKNEVPQNPTLIDKATPGFKPLEVKGTSVETQVPIANRYTPPDQLPTIDYGAAAKDTSGLPSIQTEVKANPTKLGDLTLEPIKQATPDIVSSMETLHKATQVGDAATAQATLKDIQTKVTDLTAKVEQAQQTPAKTESIAGPKTSGVASRAQEGAIKQGLIDSGYTDLAKYEGTTDEAAAKGLANLRDSGMENYRAVLRGEKPLPEGVKPGAMLVDAANYLKENPKGAHVGEMVREIATSPLTGHLSEAASTLQSAHGINDTFIGKIAAIKKAREAKAGEVAMKRAKSIPKEAQKSMKKVNLSEKDLGKLQDFIDKITC